MNPLAIVLIGTIIVLLLIAVGDYVSSKSERSMIEDRLGRFLDGDAGKEEK